MENKQYHLDMKPQKSACFCLVYFLLILCYPVEFYNWPSIFVSQYQPNLVFRFEHWIPDEESNKNIELVLQAFGSLVESWEGVQRRRRVEEEERFE